MSNYWNNGNAVAFSRGQQAFFAMAKSGSMNEKLQTGLPAGTYCNIIDDCVTSITVGSDGFANVVIDNYDEPILAVCLGCGTGSGTRPPTVPTTTGPTLPPLEGVQRTIVFIQKQTNTGQDLFVRGGIDATKRPPCTDVSSSCSLAFTVRTGLRSDSVACYLIVFM